MIDNCSTSKHRPSNYNRLGKIRIRLVAGFKLHRAHLIDRAQWITCSSRRILIIVCQIIHLLQFLGHRVALPSQSIPQDQPLAIVVQLKILRNSPLNCIRCLALAQALELPSSNQTKPTANAIRITPPQENHKLTTNLTGRSTPPTSHYKPNYALNYTRLPESRLRKAQKLEYLGSRLGSIVHTRSSSGNQQARRRARRQPSCQARQAAAQALQRSRLRIRS